MLKQFKCQEPGLLTHGLFQVLVYPDPGYIVIGIIAYSGLTGIVLYPGPPEGAARSAGSGDAIDLVDDVWREFTGFQHAGFHATRHDGFSDIGKALVQNRVIDIAV